ncbi:MAG: hypothetical protein ACLPYS_02320 [Vulcanimicrobiaceae bacterium]
MKTVPSRLAKTGEDFSEDRFDERAGGEAVEPGLGEGGEAVAGADDGAGDRGDGVGVSPPEAAVAPIAVAGSPAKHVAIAWAAATVSQPLIVNCAVRVTASLLAARLFQLAFDGRSSSGNGFGILLDRP